MDRISEHMTSFPMTLEPSANIGEAIELMKKHKIRHIPVVKGRQVVGLLSDREIHRYKDYLDSTRTLVADVMIRDPFVIKKGAPLKDVVQQMASKKFGSAVITNEDDRVLGIFTTVDALRILAQLLDDEDNYHAAVHSRLIDEYLGHDYSELSA